MAKKKAKKKRTGQSQADALKSQRRVDEILRIRLDGAEWWDVVEFVREKQADPQSPWFVPPNGKPLGEAMIRIYQRKADELILSSHEKSRKKLLRRHLAQRRHLYARATTTGDIRTALACIQDEARMLGLYPAEKSKTELTGKGGAALVAFIEVNRDAPDRGSDPQRQARLEVQPPSRPAEGVG